MSDITLDGSAIPAPIALIAINLADEGVPISAIARSIKFSSELVREVLLEAMEPGTLLVMPREDWVPGSSRESHSGVQAVRKWDEKDLVMNCSRLFKVTRLQASLLSILLRKSEVSKDMMHTIIEQQRTDPNKKDETDPKMVDVVICHLRKRLKPFKLIIKTLWACGYYMEADQRKKAMDLLSNYANGAASEKKAA